MEHIFPRIFKEIVGNFGLAHRDTFIFHNNTLILFAGGGSGFLESVMHADSPEPQNIGSPRPRTLEKLKACLIHVRVTFYWTDPKVKYAKIAKFPSSIGILFRNFLSHNVLRMTNETLC